MGVYGEIQDDNTYSIQAIWHLDDLTDDSGNGNTCTNNGASLVYAHYAQGYEYDASNDYLNCGSGSSIDDIFDAGGTIAAWLYVHSDGTVNAGRLSYKKFNSGWQLITQDESAGYVKIKFVYDWTSGDGKWTTTAAELPINTWVFFIFSYNSSSVNNDPSLWVNGTSIAFTETDTPGGNRVSDATSVLYIGNQSNANRGFDGIIDEVVFWDRPLTDGEIYALNAQQLGVYGIQ